MFEKSEEPRDVSDLFTFKQSKVEKPIDDLFPELNTQNQTEVEIMIPVIPVSQQIDIGFARESQTNVLKDRYKESIYQELRDLSDYSKVE